jgi:hypothetical protein
VPVKLWIIISIFHLVQFFGQGRGEIEALEILEILGTVPEGLHAMLEVRIEGLACRELGHGKEEPWELTQV